MSHEHMWHNDTEVVDKEVSNAIEGEDPDRVVPGETTVVRSVIGRM